MTQLLKYLKSSIGPILVIFLLLMTQAWCDLSLPSYTSNIVNIGIQSNGITEIAPEEITETDMNKVLLFMTDTEKTEVLSQYELQDSNYVRKENADITKLDETLAKPMAIVYSLSTAMKDEETGAEYKLEDRLKQQIVSQLPSTEGMNVEQLTFYDLYSTMGKDAKEQIMSSFDKQFDSMEESTLHTMAAFQVKAVYENAGVDVNDIQMGYLITTGVKMLTLALLSMVAAIMVTLLASRVAAKVSLDLRGRVFEKVVSFSSQETDHFSTASLITRSTNDIQQIQMLIVMMLRMVLYAPILGIGGVIKVINTSVDMAWIIAVAVGAILVIVLVLLVVAMPKFNRMQKLVDRMNLVTREILTGLPVIRAFSTEKHEEKRFRDANQDLMKNSLFTSRVMTFMMPIMMLIMNIVTIAIIWNGAHGVDAGTIQTGDMMAFMQYAMQIVMSFLMLTMVSIILPRASVSAKRIDEVLVMKNTIVDKKDAKKFEHINGEVSFNHVSFAYPNADEEALFDINFTAKPGQTTAIIGSTGCGKSTLVHLIPRLYDVTEGSITIDGVDIRDVSQHDLRDIIGFVPQKGVLFSGTIDSNLRYGKQNASQEAIEKAARIAQATDFIQAKADQYESEISQGGTNVSGGQKQRLSIARAIAKDPKIYIFDDSFSALDYKTDVALRRALKEETGDSTVIIVAQRISTILHADQIIVLEEGRIAGIGTHKELLSNNDVYRQIALSQLSEKELAEDASSETGKEVADHE